MISSLTYYIIYYTALKLDFIFISDVIIVIMKKYTFRTLKIVSRTSINKFTCQPYKRQMSWFIITYFMHYNNHGTHTQWISNYYFIMFTNILKHYLARVKYILQNTIPYFRDICLKIYHNIIAPYENRYENIRNRKIISPITDVTYVL